MLRKDRLLALCPRKEGESLVHKGNVKRNKHVGKTPSLSFLWFPSFCYNTPFCMNIVFVFDIFASAHTRPHPSVLSMLSSFILAPSVCLYILSCLPLLYTINYYARSTTHRPKFLA